MNKCAHPKCYQTKPKNMYACKGHWISLPRNIKDKISESFNTNKIMWLNAHKEAQKFWNNQ